jgi:hypothetical protein
MHDNTDTRMLLTTAVFVTAAALFAAGANARIPEDTSSASAAQESLRLGRYEAGAPSWRGKGGKGEETEGYRGQVSFVTGVDAAQAPSWQGKGGKGEE